MYQLVPRSLPDALDERLSGEDDEKRFFPVLITYGCVRVSKIMFYHNADLHAIAIVLI